MPTLNTQEVKSVRCLISTRQNNVRIFGHSYVAFNKATNGQTDTKHEKERKLQVWSLDFKNSIFAREGAFQLNSSTVHIQLSLFLLFVFYICLSVCRFCMPKIRTLFCLVNIEKRSFLTSCVFRFVFLNANCHLCFRFFFSPAHMP